MYFITGVFIAFILLAIAIYDIWVIIYYGMDASISRYIKQLSVKWPFLMPILAFAAGLLYGHFFL